MNPIYNQTMTFSSCGAYRPQNRCRNCTRKPPVRQLVHARISCSQQTPVLRDCGTAVELQVENQSHTTLHDARYLRAQRPTYAHRVGSMRPRGPIQLVGLRSAINPNLSFGHNLVRSMRSCIDRVSCTFGSITTVCLRCLTRLSLLVLSSYSE